MTPNGFELGAAGTILVTTKEKVIAQFDTLGNRLANNASALPGSGVSLCAWDWAGVVDSAHKARLYATIHDGSKVLRFNENGVVTGQINLGINPPYGITAASFNSFAPMSADSEASVSMLEPQHHVEQVNIAGFASALCTDFVDPRESPFVVDSNLVVCVKPDGTRAARSHGLRLHSGHQTDHSILRAWLAPRGSRRRHRRPRVSVTRRARGFSGTDRTVHVQAVPGRLFGARRVRGPHRRRVDRTDLAGLRPRSRGLEASSPFVWVVPVVLFHASSDGIRN